MANYFVFRICTEDNPEAYRALRDELIHNHILRQGWGMKGLSINEGKDEDECFRSFESGYKKVYGEDCDENQLKSRFNILNRMKSIKKDDYIIIPRISLELEHFYCNEFIICKCDEEYNFNVIEEKFGDDFGHYIKVKELYSCSYSYDMNSEIIKSKFRSYQSCVNRIWNSDFTKAVDDLLKKFIDGGIKRNETSSYLEKIKDKIVDKEEKYFEEIRNEIVKTGGEFFEKLIVELFDKNGYSMEGSHKYNGKGADADAIFAFSKGNLLDDIFEYQSGNDINRPYIIVQAKNKKGLDNNDIKGVEQLKGVTEMEQFINYSNIILVLINLQDDFSEEAKREAENNNIVLINGKSFIRLLVKYGLYNTIEC